MLNGRDDVARNLRVLEFLQFGENNDCKYTISLVITSNNQYVRYKFFKTLKKCLKLKKYIVTYMILSEIF